MKLGKLRSVSFPQILGVRHPRFMIPQFSLNSVCFLIKYGRIHASPAFTDEISKIATLRSGLKEFREKRTHSQLQREQLRFPSTSTSSAADALRSIFLFPAAARHGVPPAACDAASDAFGVAKHRRFHRQAPWALLIVVVTGSILDGAATLAIVPSRSLCGTQQTWRAFCPASTALPSSTARASSSPSSTSGRRLFLRLHVMVRRLLRALQLMPLV